MIFFYNSPNVLMKPAELSHRLHVHVVMKSSVVLRKFALLLLSCVVHLDGDGKINFIQIVRRKK